MTSFRPARCIIAAKDVVPKSSGTFAITLQFSHRNYAELYSNYLAREALNENYFSYSIDGKAVQITCPADYAPTDCIGGELVFASEENAEKWGSRMGLCEGCGSSKRRRIVAELSPEAFRKKLDISEEDWVRPSARLIRAMLATAT